MLCDSDARIAPVRVHCRRSWVKVVRDGDHAIVGAGMATCASMQKDAGASVHIRSVSTVDPLARIVEGIADGFFDGHEPLGSDRLVMA